MAKRTTEERVKELRDDLASLPIGGHETRFLRGAMLKLMDTFLGTPEEGEQEGKEEEKKEGATVTPITASSESKSPKASKSKKEKTEEVTEEKGLPPTA